MEIKELINKKLNEIIDLLKLLDKFPEIPDVPAPVEKKINKPDEINMDFSQALLLAKKHIPIQREGWNGKGLCVKLQEPDSNSKMNLPYLYIEYPDGRRCPWLASQTDIMAEDWRIFEIDERLIIEEQSTPPIATACERTYIVMNPTNPNFGHSVKRLWILKDSTGSEYLHPYFCTLDEIKKHIIGTCWIAYSPTNFTLLNDWNML